VQDVKITDDWKGYFSFCKQIRDPHDKPTEEEKDKYCDFKERLDLEMDLYSKKAIYDKLLVIFRASNNGTYRRKGKKHLNDPELWYNAGSTWGAAMSKVVMEWEYLYQYMDNPPSPPPPPSLQKKKKFKVILDEYKKKRDEINSKAITIQNIEDAWKDSLKYVSSIITGEEILEKKWRPYQDTLQTIALHNINLHVDVGSNCDCQNMNVAAWTFASGKDVHLRPNAINKLVGGANCQWYLGVPSKHEMEDIIDSWGLTRSHLKSKEFQALIESLFAVERMMPLVEEAFNNIRAVGDLGEMLLRHDQRENVKFLVFPGAPGGMTPPKFAGPSGRNERGDNTGHSVIFWDPFSDFIFFAEDPDDDSKIYAERIPAWIVLGHELGHLRQFTMYPHWVKEVFKQTYDESKYPDIKQYGRDLDFPHNIQRYEHSLCDHGNFGKRQAYPAQNQAEFPGKALNREKSRDQLNARRTVSLIAWSNDPESPEDEAVRESVIDAARIIAKITQRITNHGDGFKLMERALSEDIYGSLKTQFRDLL
jgi:hypothetical protein